MSWSASVGMVEKAEFAAAVDAAATSPSGLDAPMAAQHEAAKAALKALAEALPGPRLSASMGGHANGVGDAEKPGWSNDYVTLSIYQRTDVAS